MKRLVCVFAALLSTTINALLSAQDCEATWQWLSAESRGITEERLTDSAAVYTLLDLATCCDQQGRKELAGEFQRRAEEIADRNERRLFQRPLFAYAISVDRLDLAEKYAEDASPDTRKRLLDKLAVERYRRGDKKADEGYPRDKMDMFNALDMANAYVDAGEYDKAEDFVTDIVISEENDPRAVTSDTLNRIADKYREAGDMEQARQYADKAYAIGRRLYYTGYAVEVKHRSIHGKLLKGLDEFAQLAANHQGHHGRELVQVLVRELYQTGHYQEARETLEFLEDTDDQQRSLRYIALHQAEHESLTKAFAEIEKISDPHQKAMGRIGMAILLWKQDRRSEAEKIAEEVLAADNLGDDWEQHRRNQQLAYILGAMCDKERLETLFGLDPEPEHRPDLLKYALRGLAGQDSLP